jgi:penicillin-binding protein 1A
VKFFKFILKWVFFLSIWIAIFGTLALFYYFKGLPNLSDLEAKSGNQILQINYFDGERITNRGEIYSSEISYYELPQHLIDAVVATEDRKFFKHHGIDIFGILRASYVNHEAGRIVQGGSTITQQLAKLLFLDPQRTFKRKIQEILLALQLERRFTKEQILTFYLNKAYFGSGSYGINDAAKHYFNKDVSRITLKEAALLAGLLKAPSKFSPKNNRELAQDRAEIVIRNMIDAGFLDEKNLKQINQDTSYEIDHSQKLYFADFVQDQLPEFLLKKFSEENLLSVVTTLDEDIQNNLEDILDNFAEKNAKKLGKSQIAVIVMKPDGAIVGMSGGIDYQRSQFNRAVKAKRQAGSAFKTFVYLAAFESGMNVDDVIEDKKINIGTWLPENYEGRYMGEVTLRQAFANSLNSVAVQLARQVGGKSVAEMANSCGIVTKIDKDDPTIALGTTEVSLLEMVGSYAAIANSGSPVIPYAILEVKNSADAVLYLRESSGFDSVISAESQEKIRNVLRAVVEEGTGKKANVASDIYGKTGTSQNFRDAWFVGFNSEYVIGVWIGNDDNSATNKITGGSLPAEIFAEIVKKI